MKWIGLVAGLMLAWLIGVLLDGESGALLVLGAVGGALYAGLRQRVTRQEARATELTARLARLEAAVALPGLSVDEADGTAGAAGVVSGDAASATPDDVAARPAAGAGLQQGSAMPRPADPGALAHEAVARSNDALAGRPGAEAALPSDFEAADHPPAGANRGPGPWLPDGTGPASAAAPSSPTPESVIARTSADEDALWDPIDPRGDRVAAHAADAGAVADEGDDRGRAVTTSLGATLTTWIRGGNTIVRAAVLILFIGIAFLLRYVAERATVPLEVRLGLVAVGGVALAALGLRLARHRRGYALTLQGAGVGIVYLTLFASYRLYTLVPPGLAFALLAALAAITALLAVRQDALPLAVIGFGGAFLAPVLASSGQGHPAGLFGYYLLINLAIAWIAGRQSWKLLNLVGFVFTFTIGLAWGARAYTPAQFWSVEPFVVAHFLLYLYITIQYTRGLAREPLDDSAVPPRAARATAAGPRRPALVDGGLLFGVPIVVFGVQAAVIRHVPYGVACSALAMAAIYLVVGLRLWRRAGQRVMLLVEGLFGLGVAFLALVPPLVLDARWTAAAWAVQGAGVLWIGLRQRRGWAAGFGLLLQLLAALRFWSDAHRAADAVPLVNATVIGACLLGGVAIWSAWQLRRAAAGMTPARAGAADTGSPLVAMPQGAPYADGGGTPTAAEPASASASAPLSTPASTSDATPPPGSAQVQPPASTPALPAPWTSPAPAPGSPSRSPLPRSRPLSLAARLDELLTFASHAMLALGVLQTYAGLRLEAAALAPARLDESWLTSVLLAACAALAFAGAGRLAWPALQVAARLLLPAALLVSAGAVIDAFGASSGVRYLQGAGLVEALWLLALGGLFDRRLQRGVVARWAHASGGQPVVLHRTAPPTAADEPPDAPSLAAPVSTTPAGASPSQVPALAPSATTKVADGPPAPFPSAPSQPADGPAPTPPRLVFPHVSDLVRGIEKCLLGWYALLQGAAFTHALMLTLVPRHLAWTAAAVIVLPTLLAGWLARRAATGRAPVDEQGPAIVAGLLRPWALLLALWSLLANLFSDGSMAPLPYLPLLNPIDLAHGLVVVYLLRLRQARPLPTPARAPALAAAAAVAFWWMNAVLARSLHHWAGTPMWLDGALDADAVQTGLTVLWTVCALVVMLLGSRRALRPLWMAGAVLLGVVVAKLFVVDLANVGALARIVSFIAVGLLMLVIGYLSPMPPARKAPLVT